MKKFLAFILFIGISSQAFASWPSSSARTKDWGTETLTDADLEGQFDLLHTYLNDALNASTGHDHDGTTGNGPKIPINSSLTISSQATGDVIYASSSTVWARLGIGSAGQVLSVSGGVPAWATVNISPQYRNNLSCAQASSTTITCQPGSVEINGTVVSKTSATTLTLTTNGDWAGGTSLQATSTYVYVGIDTSGNLKLHTTAPTHSDYGVSLTTGKKRYATWGSTVYRIIGWGYMNATGSGELNSWEVGNLKDVSVVNSVLQQSTSSQTINSASYTTINNTTIHFYSSGNPVNLVTNFTVVDSGAGVTTLTYDFNRGASSLSSSEKIASSGFSTGYYLNWSNDYQEQPAQGPLTYLVEMKASSNSFDIKNRTFRITEL